MEKRRPSCNSIQMDLKFSLMFSYSYSGSQGDRVYANMSQMEDRETTFKYYLDDYLDLSTVSILKSTKNEDGRNRRKHDFTNWSFGW